MPFDFPVHQALSHQMNPPRIKEMMQGIIARYLIQGQGLS